MNLIPCTSISFIFCISFLALQKFSTEGKKINSVGFFTEAQKPDICIKQLKGKVYFVKVSAWNVGDLGSGKIPWRRKMATHSSTLAWRIEGGAW